MTPADLIAARRALGITQGEMAARLGVGLRTVQHWEFGDRAIPEPVARLITITIRRTYKD